MKDDVKMENEKYLELSNKMYIYIHIYICIHMYIYKFKSCGEAANTILRKTFIIPFYFFFFLKKRLGCLCVSVWYMDMCVICVVYVCLCGICVSVWYMFVCVIYVCVARVW